MQQNKCRKLPPGDQMSNYAIKQRYLLAFSCTWSGREVTAGCRRLEQIKTVLISVNEGPWTPGDKSLVQHLIFHFCFSLQIPSSNMGQQVTHL